MRYDLSDKEWSIIRPMKPATWHWFAINGNEDRRSLPFPASGSATVDRSRKTDPGWTSKLIHF